MYYLSLLILLVQVRAVILVLLAAVLVEELLLSVDCIIRNTLFFVHMHIVYIVFHC